jgi:hypothetical protein
VQIVLYTSVLRIIAIECISFKLLDSNEQIRKSKVQLYSAVVAFAGSLIGLCYKFLLLQHFAIIR